MKSNHSTRKFFAALALACLTPALAIGAERNPRPTPTHNRNAVALTYFMLHMQQKVVMGQA